MDTKYRTPKFIWVYRSVVLFGLFMILKQAIRSEICCTETRLVLSVVLAPIFALALGISWVRRSIVTWMMAFFVFVTPLAFAVIIRSLVFQSSAWWECMLAMCVVMTVPTVAAWCLIKDPTIRTYYSRKHKIQSYP